MKSAFQNFLGFPNRSAAPSPPNGRLTSTTMQPRNRQTINVILFGEMGVGKSAVINLIAQRQVAELSSYFRGSLLQSTCYDISFDGMNFSLFETAGLEEPRIGVNRYLEALEQAYELIVKLDAAGGVHLLLFVMEAGKIRATTQSNYWLFFEAIFQTRVPIALVFTGLEREVEMEDWWRRNQTHIEQYDVKSDGHACITAVQGDTPGEDLKYVESQKRIRDLLKDFYLQRSGFRPDLDSWFAHLGNRMQDFIENGRKPKKKDKANVLSKRLRLDASKVQKLMYMMEKGDIQPSSGAGQVNAPGEYAINKMEALISARDLTGHVTKSSNHPFASGSFGDIYRGHLNRRGRSIDVVIKTHRLYVQDDEHLPEKMKQLRKELTVWLDLEHPNILKLLGIARDLGVNPYLPAMVCPWVKNGALTTYLKRNMQLTAPQRMALVNGVALGLDHLHSQDIVHGDLSGSNVLVHADGRACIADFGLSVLLTRLEGSTFAMSRQARGTARWAAPELFRFDDSKTTPSTRSDVYSFGSIMLQILTGDIPYHYITREEQVILAVGTGRVHKRPDETIITDDRWQLMEWCWSPVDAAKPRPTSDEIVEFTKKDLSDMAATIY